MTRAELRKQRSSLAEAWDRNVRAIRHKPGADEVPGGVRTEIASSWKRSARHISPDVTEALLASEDDTRAAWESSPLSASVRHVGNVMRKLGATRRAEAVYAASKIGLI